MVGCCEVVVQSSYEGEEEPQVSETRVLPGEFTGYQQVGQESGVDVSDCAKSKFGCLKAGRLHRRPRASCRLHALVPRPAIEPAHAPLYPKELRSS